MRDYSKQNKAVFLSDGRCVLEEDAPKFEEHLRKKDKLIASTEIPRGIHGKLDLIEKFDELVHPSKIYSNASVEYYPENDKSDFKWCNTCSIGQQLKSYDDRYPNRWGCTDYDERNDEMKKWYRESNMSSILGTYHFDIKSSCPFHQPKEQQSKNCNTCSTSGEYASKCPANNINDIKYNTTNDWWNVCCKLFFSAGFSNEADNCPGWKEKK